MKITTKTLSFVALAACSASAATISWDAAVINTTAADIITDGSLHIAVDAASSNDNTINGVTFVGGNPLVQNAEGNFWTGAGVNTTGDAGLDDLLNSHSYTGGTPSLASFNIDSLTVGDSYAIQIIAVGDTRGCCGTRTQNYDGGGGISADLTQTDLLTIGDTSLDVTQLILLGFLLRLPFERGLPLTADRPLFEGLQTRRLLAPLLPHLLVLNRELLIESRDRFDLHRSIGTQLSESLEVSFPIHHPFAHRSPLHGHAFLAFPNPGITKARRQGILS